MTEKSKETLLSEFHRYVQELSPTHSVCKLCETEAVRHHHYGKLNSATLSAHTEHAEYFHRSIASEFKAVCDALSAVLDAEERERIKRETRDFKLNYR